MPRNLKEITILKRMRALLSDPKRWTKGTLARVRKGGKKCEPRAKEATCWCLYGALEKVAPGQLLPEVFRSVVPLPAAFNDHRSTRHPDILKALDRAIEIEAKRVRA